MPKRMELKFQNYKMQSKEEILKVFPNAVFFPQDKIPIGQIVSWEGQGKKYGTVVGGGPFYNGDANRHKGICTTCSCPALEICIGWWKVLRRDGKTELKYPPDLCPETEMPKE